MHLSIIVTSVVFLLAVIDWIAVYKQWKKIEYVAKPATILALLLLVWLSVGFGGEMIWFTIGLIFCLVGDIFLMLNEKMFVYGLLAFLIGQIFYVFAFNTRPPYFNWYGFISLIILSIYIGWLYPKLTQGLKEKGNNQLILPVLGYSIVISLMVYSAVMAWSRSDWPESAAFIAIVGAILFYASDSILAWDRFINHLPRGRIVSVICYHLGQISIIFGSILYAI